MTTVLFSGLFNGFLKRFFAFLKHFVTKVRNRPMMSASIGKPTQLHMGQSESVRIRPQS